MRHLGLSTHQNAEQVLETAARTSTCDLAMIAITPAGWYDWADMQSLAHLQENVAAAASSSRHFA